MDERMKAQIDRMNRLSGWDIFERRDGHEHGGYKFVVPGIMISADDVKVDFDRATKEWVVSHEDGVNTWTGRGDDLVRAYLDLIAGRCGLREDATDG